MDSKKENRFISGFSTPGFYQIDVLGKLPAELSEKLNGMEIYHVEKEERQISILKGILPDQAALSGVLNNLYDMHLTILSVERNNKNK